MIANRIIGMVTTRSRNLIAILALLGLSCAGCVAVYPASGLRAQSHNADGPARTEPRPQPRPEAPQTAESPNPGEPAGTRWPARWNAGTPDAPRGAIVPSEHRVASLRPAHLGRFHHLRTGEAEYRQAEALARAVGVEDGFRFEPEGPGSLVFMPPIEAEPEEAPAPAGRDESEVFVFVSAQTAPESTPEDQRVSIERTWMALYDAKAPEPKGTIVLIPGMLGTPQPIVEGMVRYWRNSGYTVLRMLSHPSRFTERVEVPIADGQEAAAGERLARIYDQRTAECAYAADAGLDRVFAQRPALADKPVVLVGMSGGAMVLPTVYAYAPGRYDAAVLIAGGVNFLKISALSNYADWIDAIVIDWDPDNPDSNGRPTPERLNRLSDAYLASSRLDATHTAGELADIPVLMLHATNDKAVPSAQGEALWRLLGTPERWVFPVGHELIFVMLPTQGERLTAWIDQAIGAEP